MIKISIIEGLSGPGIHKKIELEEGLGYRLFLIELPERGDRKDKIPYAIIPIITPKEIQKLSLVQFLDGLETKIARVKKDIIAESGTLVK